MRPEMGEVTCVIEIDLCRIDGRLCCLYIGLCLLKTGYGVIIVLSRNRVLLHQSFVTLCAITRSGKISFSSSKVGFRAIE
ncbi:hypothetical protein JCM19233_875 [Vibrio astriarenae]|nr:hypothetical protein JCM19233_875 [Vibrio sp. C7]